MRVMASEDVRPGDGAQLTIGDLADRTGVAAATLRMWEQRHGFPEPHRLPSGHRRYRQSDVEEIVRVVGLRDAGVRLDLAIRQARAAGEPGVPSVYAYLRQRHPQIATHRLTKRTLLGLSWAIEDEFCAKAEQADVFGAFQREQFYARAEPRWSEIAQLARSTTVLADFATSDTSASPAKVALPEGAPMRREWAVVCDAPDLPVVLTAWELPGQRDTPDRERLFESMWSVDPAAVHDAARVCAHVSGLGDLPVLPRRTGEADAAAVTRLFNRVVAYVDRLGSGLPKTP